METFTTIEEAQFSATYYGGLTADFVDRLIYSKTTCDVKEFKILSPTYLATDSQGRQQYLLVLEPKGDPFLIQ